MLNIEENRPVCDLCTLRIGGSFRYFTEIEKAEDLEEAYSFARNHEVPVFILGGGSNIVFSDGVINVLAVKMKILGFSAQGGSASGGQNYEYVDIKVGAGECWDEIVEKIVEMNLAGLESLSAIPGTVGATPVQNVGAYGAEVADTIISVEVFDTKDNTIKNLSNTDCKFSYRDSIFKNEAKGRYVITAVTYRLKKGIGSLKQRCQEIIEIRWKKLPHPEEIPNVGSFFKNPFVKNEIADKIQKEYPNAKFYPVNEKITKIPAGWLIETAGLKGKSFGKVSVYDKNALVLINNGGATKNDLICAKNEIIKTVQEKFGITLEQEPEMI